MMEKQHNGHHNLTLLFGLIMLMGAFKLCTATEAINHTLATDSSSNGLGRTSLSGIADKLASMRHWLKSALAEWNFGESEMNGRTFGHRIRMIRQMMLPLAFIGGFLTAVILGIKLTGVLNMLMLGKMLMLNVAIVLGKLLFGGKLLVEKLQHHDTYTPYYVPVPQAPTPPVYYPSGGGSGYGQSHYASNRVDWQQQPQQFRQSLTNFQLPPPQSNFGQPQVGSFVGIQLQKPHQVGSTPYSFLDEEEELAFAAPKPQLSPSQMTQLLSDALAKISNRNPTAASRFR